MRHHLGQLVHQAERHFQHAADVAQHAARQKGAEGDDLRHPFGAIAGAHIGDDFVAPGLAEVDVEIRHGYAFGIEESLEQQGKAQGIEIGDGQGVGDQRTGAGTAPRPHRNFFGFGEFDEIRHDQEIAGKFHFLDDRQFEIEPVAIVSLGQARRRPMRGKARGKTHFGLGAQFGGLVGSLGEIGQDRLSRARPVGTAQRDDHAVARRLRQIGEKRQHFRPRLEAVLRGQAAAVVLSDQGSVGNAQQASWAS